MTASLGDLHRNQHTVIYPPAVKYLLYGPSGAWLLGLERLHQDLPNHNPTRLQTNCCPPPIKGG
eukprot:scaffold135240_cov62-Attheya_sp.AAC.4